MELTNSEWITILGLATIDGVFLFGVWAYIRHVRKSTAAQISEVRKFKTELRRGRDLLPLCDLSSQEDLGPISDEERERVRLEGVEWMLGALNRRRSSQESTQE